VASERDEQSRDASLTVRVCDARADSRAVEQPIAITTTPSGALEERMRPGARSPIDLTRALVQWAVDHTNYYVFHAGAVRRGNLGVLLPADSLGGKSTLTAALGQRGFALLSDEVGVVDRASDRLIAFPRALSLRHDVLALLRCPESAGASFDGGASRMLRASELEIERAESGAEVSLVVLPRYQAGAPTEMRRLNTGRAVLALMQASCSQPRFKVDGLDFVIALARRVPCYELVFSDLGHAVEQIEIACEQIEPRAPAREQPVRP
jgi:hypothetical protein